MQGRAEATQSGPATSRDTLRRTGCWGQAAEVWLNESKWHGGVGTPDLALSVLSLSFLLDPQHKPPTLSQLARELPKVMGRTCPDWRSLVLDLLLGEHRGLSGDDPYVSYISFKNKNKRGGGWRTGGLRGSPV